MNYDPKTKKTRKFYEGEKGNKISDDKGAFGGAFGDKKKNKSDDDDDDDDEVINKKNKIKNPRDTIDEEEDDDDEKTKKSKKFKKNKEEEEDEEDENDKKKNKKKDEEDEDESKDKKLREDKEVAKPIKENPIPMDSTEIGIPELMKLYYDVYDEKKKDYTSMSPEMRKIYQNDVDIFYRTFTGKEVETDENGDKKITSFQQIPLNEYHKSDGCKPDGVYTKTYEGSLTRTDLNENLFEKYASHVNKMMNTMNSNQDKLLVILKKLFIFKNHVEEKPKPVEKNESNIATNKQEDIAQSTQKNRTIPLIYQEPAAPVAEGKAAVAAVAEGTAAAAEGTAAAAEGTAAAAEGTAAAAEGKAAVAAEGTAAVAAEGTVAEGKAAEGTSADINQKGGESKKEEQDAIINPALDESLLQTLINSARQLIVNLYVTCENDFVEGLHIFEAIVATQLGRNVNSQIKLLDELTLDYLARKNTDIDTE
jgi:hypothetical protein